MERSKATPLITICLFVFVFCSNCYAADEWTKTDKALLGASLGLRTIDYLQTKEIARNPNYHETNPCLGRHPTQGQVDTYFLATAIGEIVIAHFLPSKWRRVWLGVWIGVSGACVTYNYTIGIRF